MRAAYLKNPPVRFRLSAGAIAALFGAFCAILTLSACEGRSPAVCSDGLGSASDLCSFDGADGSFPDDAPASNDSAPADTGDVAGGADVWDADVWDADVWDADVDAGEWFEEDVHGPDTEDAQSSDTDDVQEPVPPGCDGRRCGPSPSGLGSCGECPAEESCLPDGSCSVCEEACGGTIRNSAEEYCDEGRDPPRCVVGECREGFVAEDDIYCVPLPHSACQPCATSSDCVAGSCARLAGELRCTFECRLDVPFDCPDGYACRSANAADAAPRCEPSSGSCDCTPTSDGATTDCVVTNEHGSCAGVRRCLDGRRWGDCEAPAPAPEACDLVDNDCDGVTDEPGSVGCVEYNRDSDGDGWGTSQTRCLCAPEGEFSASRQGDCHDLNPDIHPDALEICSDGFDNDCDGSQEDEDALGCRFFYEDADRDGFGVPPGRCLCHPTAVFRSDRDDDCDDAAYEVNPWMYESCATPHDDNCDGRANEPDAIGCQARFRDGDADGYGSGESRCLCEPADGYDAVVGGDCDDELPAVHPGAEETCNDGLDDDCDGAADGEGAGGCVPYHRDYDGDGFGRVGDTRCLCGPDGAHVIRDPARLDCNDMIAQINPDAPEVCNYYDDNCNLLVDEEEDPYLCDPGPD